MSDPHAMQRLCGLMRKAVQDYEMISPGDKIMVGVSGGKDSVALTIGLAQLRRYLGFDYEVVAVTLDPQFDHQAVDYSPLAALFARYEVPYEVRRTEIGPIVFEYRKEKNPCSLCARLRRGALHTAAQELGCNKVALGHHLDDAVETFYMNLWREGRIGCFSPVTQLDRRGLTLIRPMLLATEHEVRCAVKEEDLPIVKSRCPADGVTVHVPLKALSRLTPEQFTWNVPGLLDELIVGLIKSLPKSLRVQFVPAPDTARKIRAWIDDRYPALPGTGTSDGQGHAWPDLPHVFTQAAIDTVGAQIHPEVLTGELWEKLPAYLRMTFSIEQQLPAPRNARGRRHARGPVKVLGSGKSLTALQRQFAEQAEASARRMVEHKAEQAASRGKLVEQANLLHKAGATSESRAVMLWRGALDALRMPSERISSRWLGAEALMLASAPYPSTKALVEDLQLATVKRLLPNIDTLPDDDALADAVMGVTEVYEDTVYALAHDVIAILRAYANVDKATSGKADLPMLSVLQSVREHIATLVFPGFIGATPPAALPRIPKYLEADLIRLTKAKNDKNRDVRWAWEADEARQLVDKAVQRAKTEPAGPRHEALTKQADDARWMLEEFYVSLWAQELGTAKPVSLQRIKKTLGK